MPSSTSPEPKQTAAKKAEEAPAEPTMGVWERFNTPAEAVPVSGMLADDASLNDEQLTAAEWDAKLDAYSKSPRP